MKDKNLSIKDTFQVPNVHSPIVLLHFLTSERGQPPYCIKLRTELASLKCPLFNSNTNEVQTLSASGTSSI